MPTEPSNEAVEMFGRRLDSIHRRSSLKGFFAAHKQRPDLAKKALKDTLTIERQRWEQEVRDKVDGALSAMKQASVGILKGKADQEYVEMLDQAYVELRSTFGEAEPVKEGLTWPDDVACKRKDVDG